MTVWETKVSNRNMLIIIGAINIIPSLRVRGTRMRTDMISSRIFTTRRYLVAKNMVKNCATSGVISGIGIVQISEAKN